MFNLYKELILMLLLIYANLQFFQGSDLFFNSLHINTYIVMLCIMLFQNNVLSFILQVYETNLIFSYYFLFGFNM